MFTTRSALTACVSMRAAAQGCGAPSSTFHSRDARRAPLRRAALKHRTSVTFMMCSLSRVGSAGGSWRAPFPAVGSVRVDPHEQLGAEALDLAQEALPLGSFSTGAAAAQGVLIWASSSCVSGRSRVSARGCEADGKSTFRLSAKKTSK